MWRWLKEWFQPKSDALIQQLLAEAVRLGLSTRDAANAQEMLEHNEWGVAFDIIVTQLFEYATPLTAAFYEQVEACADAMEISAQQYSILLLLVKAPPG